MTASWRVLIQWIVSDKELSFGEHIKEILKELPSTSEVPPGLAIYFYF